MLSFHVKDTDSVKPKQPARSLQAVLPLIAFRLHIWHFYIKSYAIKGLTLYSFIRLHSPLYNLKWYGCKQFSFFLLFQFFRHYSGFCFVIEVWNYLFKIMYVKKLWGVTRKRKHNYADMRGRLRVCAYMQSSLKVLYCVHYSVKEGGLIARILSCTVHICSNFFIWRVTHNVECYIKIILEKSRKRKISIV